MRSLPALLAVAVLGAGLAGCGDDAQTEVEATFRGYHTAVLARDFPAACALFTPQRVDTLLADIATQGINVPTCEEALAAVYAEPGAADTADTISRTAQIDGIVVDGDAAALTWTATLDGQPRQGSYPLLRVDGGWKLSSPG